MATLAFAVAYRADDPQRIANWAWVKAQLVAAFPESPIFVVPFHHYSAISASAALSILMLPVVIRTSESAVGLIPGGLRESGLALGLPRWRVSLQLIVPAAAPGVITGAARDREQRGWRDRAPSFHSLWQPTLERRPDTGDVSAAAHRFPRRPDPVQGSAGSGLGRGAGARDNGACDQPRKPLGPAPADPLGGQALSLRLARVLFARGSSRRLRLRERTAWT
jgi:Binding-protein-dependent transport system inner membrane component